MFFSGASMALEALFIFSRWNESGNKLQSPTCLPYLQFCLISKTHYYGLPLFIKKILCTVL